MQLTLTRKDVQNFFIYHYFFGQSIIIKFMRIVIGPLLVLIGVYFIERAHNKFEIGYGGFCIGFGIYYSLKPFILMVMRKFKDETFSFEFDVDKLLVTDRLSNSTFDLSDYPIGKISKYYFLKFENGQFLIFPIKKLSDETIKQFEQRRIIS